MQYWADKGPFRSFTEYALDLIERNRLDDAHTARVLALMSVAQADAVIAVWDAKYTWWTSRPITEDPDLDMLLPTPPYPSYPSGFSAVVGSAAVVLAHLFPRAEVDLLAERGRGGCPALLVRYPLPARRRYRAGDGLSGRAPGQLRRARRWRRVKRFPTQLLGTISRAVVGEERKRRLTAGSGRR